MKRKGITFIVLLIGAIVSISGCMDSETNNIISPSMRFPVSEAPNLAVEVLKEGGNVAIIQFKGVTLDKNQWIYILSRAIVMIDSGQQETFLLSSLEMLLNLAEI